MKLIASVVALAVLALVHAQASVKLDNVDLEAIIKTEQQMQTYINCFLDKGPCSPDGTELKKIFADAMKTDCSNCSPKFKDATKKILLHLLKSRQGWYNALEAKFDPTGIYRKKHAADAKKL